MIYRLENVYDARGRAVFDELGLREYTSGRHLRLGDGVPLGGRWQPLAISVRRRAGRRLPELYMLTGYALVASERAWQALAPRIARGVEPLPLRGGWLALNVVETRRRTGIFKRAGAVQSPVYVDGELKRFIVAEGLDGLAFRSARLARPEKA